MRCVVGHLLDDIFNIDLTECAFDDGMRFPWSDWSPHRKAKLLIAVFISLVVCLRAYSAFCDYVRKTLYNTLVNVAATLRVVEMRLVYSSSTGQPILYVTVGMRNPGRLTVELLGGFYELMLFDPWEEHDHEWFRLGNLTLPSMTLHPGEGFNKTYQFDLDEVKLESLARWGYRTRVLFWGSCSLQGSFHFLRDYRVSPSTKRDFFLEDLPIVEVERREPS